MVRNSYGGNRAKKQARKNNTGNGGNYSNNKLRLPNEDEPDEKFAIVTKILGNGQLEVQCIDNKIRICIIRNKFKGKGKQDNNIKLNTWLLVGVRSWEVVSVNKKGELKKEKCDLLEIYNDNDKEKLKERCNIDFTPLQTEYDNEIAVSNIDFVNDENNMVVDVAPQPGSKSLFVDEIDNDEIDIDEI
tara:strand:+ start:326 stop:889 length:564 start_codon:yes stop_codon:yes gene_type:complete